jgi:hypothetical protein
MRARARARDLQPSGHPRRVGCLQVGQGIQHRRPSVEVGGQPPAEVPVQQRVQPDLRPPRQVRHNHVVSQRQVVAARGILVPTATNGGHPARPARAPVLPPDRVHVRARGEQRSVEGDLLLRRRPVVHRTRRCVEDAGLRRTWQPRLTGAQIEQPLQPSVLGPKSVQFGVQRNRVAPVGTASRIPPAAHVGHAMHPRPIDGSGSAANPILYAADHRSGDLPRGRDRTTQRISTHPQFSTAVPCRESGVHRCRSECTAGSTFIMPGWGEFGPVQGSVALMACCGQSRVGVAAKQRPMQG